MQQKKKKNKKQKNKKKPTKKSRASLVAQMVKNLPVMQDTQVWFLSREETLEKGMATHSSILAWEIHGQRNLAGYSSWDRKVGHDWATNTFQEE